MLDLAFIVASYGVIAYVSLPWLWTRHEHQKALAGIPMISVTAQGIAGDPDQN
ncbi:MAG: hypothetical protein JO205_10450 [Pseudolabrys sp.]|nr:hypothetical protein [Pseudolabrys sp.]